MTTRVETQQQGSRTVHALIDDATGARARVLPSFGFNLFDLQLPVGGKPTPLLATAVDFAASPSDPARNGTPILFPYPNRVRDGKYSFGGQSYQLPLALKPNAIHGFAMDAAWDVVRHEVVDKTAVIEGKYQISKQSPQMLPMWPTDAILTVRYALLGRAVTMTVTVTNPTAKPLPYGFGIHPYFFLPFSGSDLEATRVVLPAGKVWTLKDFLPTGETPPVPAALDFRGEGKPIKGLKLDDVFTGLELEGGRYVCRLKDLKAKAELIVSFGANFRELVAYTPPGDGRVISLEPYTQTTDAINLQAKGVDAGLRVLEHDQSDTFEVRFETAELGD